MPAIAARYGTKRSKLGRMAVQRHKEEHLPKSLTKAKAARDVATADNLLDEVRTLQRVTHSILAKALKAEDLRTALSAIREARGNSELLAKLLGELSDTPQVNIVLNPIWIELRTVILQTLSAYPEARQAVARALVEAERVSH